jgi:hypothetical protein
VEVGIGVGVIVGVGVSVGFGVKVGVYVNVGVGVGAAMRFVTLQARLARITNTTNIPDVFFIYVSLSGMAGLGCDEKPGNTLSCDTSHKVIID